MGQLWASPGGANWQIICPWGLLPNNLTNVDIISSVRPGIFVGSSHFSTIMVCRTMGTEDTVRRPRSVCVTVFVPFNLNLAEMLGIIFCLITGPYKWTLKLLYPALIILLQAEAGLVQACAFSRGSFLPPVSRMIWASSRIKDSDLSWLTCQLGWMLSASGNVLILLILPKLALCKEELWSWIIPCPCATTTCQGKSCTASWSYALDSPTTSSSWIVTCD